MSGGDETRTHQRLMYYLRSVVYPTVLRSKGRILRNTGDGFLAEFPTAVEAAWCASEVQRCINSKERATPPSDRFQLRIGINYGELMIDNDMVYGNAVNVGARIEELAAPGSIYITDAVRQELEANAYFELEDLGSHTLKNITSPVRVFRLGSAPDQEPAPLHELGPCAPGASLLGAPNIAILPFVTNRNDRVLRRIADTLARSLTIRLAAWRWFGVIAPDFAHLDQASLKDAIRAARSLDVRYILRGTLRALPPRMRVGIELIDGNTGYHLWGDFIDRPLRDTLAFEDKIVAKVGALVDLEMQRSERSRAMAKSPDQVDIHDLVQRGYWHYSRRTKSHNAHAQRLFAEALERDPMLATASAGLAACFFWAAQWRWSEDPQASLHAGLDSARSAVISDARLPAAHLFLGQNLLFMGQQDAAIATARHALDLNPSYAGAWAFHGHALTAAGNFRSAIASIKRAFQLTSYDSRRFMWLSNLAIAHFHLNEFDQALRVAREAVDLHPTHWLSNQVLIATYGALDRAEEARKLIAAVRAREPNLELEEFANRLPYRREGDLTRIRDALRYAGWE
jgi:TolB-like protein/tetratricopeptide (TPR) repeat protein